MAGAFEAAAFEQTTFETEAGGPVGSLLLMGVGRWWYDEILPEAPCWLLDSCQDSDIDGDRNLTEVMMPRVKTASGRTIHYPYSKAGVKAAEKAKAKVKKKGKK